MTIDITKPLELSDDLTEGQTMRTSEEQLQRMEALLRRMASAPTVPNELGVKTAAEHQSIAREIVAELDKGKVSEDLLAAREAAASVYPNSHNSALILDGSRDGTDIVRSAIAAIAKGRELALADQSVGNAKLSLHDLYDSIGGLK